MNFSVPVYQVQGDQLHDGEHFSLMYPRDLGEVPHWSTPGHGWCWDIGFEFSTNASRSLRWRGPIGQQLQHLSGGFRDVFFLSRAQILWRWFQFLQLKYTEKKGGTYPEQIYHQDPAESHRISGWVNTDPMGHQCHRLGISAGMGQHAGIYGEGKCLQHLIMATVSLAGKPMDRLLVDEERQRFADFIQSSTQAGSLQLIL